MYTTRARAAPDRVVAPTRRRSAGQRDRFAQAGVSTDARLEAMGNGRNPFSTAARSSGEHPRGPHADTEEERRTQRDPRSMELTTLAWSPGTDGAVRGRPIAIASKHHVRVRIQPGQRTRGAWVLIAAGLPGAEGGIRANGFTSCASAWTSGTTSVKALNGVGLRTYDTQVAAEHRTRRR